MRTRICSSRFGCRSVARLVLAGVFAWPLLALAAPYRETYSFDADDRLQAVVWEINSTNAAALVEYDPAGNRTRWVAIGPDDLALDSDGDGLGDLGEARYFGHLGQTGAGDPDADGLANSNEFAQGSSPILKNTDGDAHDDYEEWVADTSPTNPRSFFHIAALSYLPPLAIYFTSSSNRLYSAIWTTNLSGSAWSNLPAQTPRRGTGGPDVLAVPDTPSNSFFRVRVQLP